MKFVYSIDGITQIEERDSSTCDVCGRAHTDGPPTCLFCLIWQRTTELELFNPSRGPFARLFQTLTPSKDVVRSALDVLNTETS